MAGDFNNFDNGPINVATYVHDFIFYQRNANGGDFWRYFLS